MTTNRNPVKQLFITFPQSGCVDKVTFRNLLLHFEPDYYKVVTEKHQDGSPHLHAVVRFKNKYSKAFMLKYFKAMLPNDYKRIDVQPVRSIKKAIKYLSKEDENPLESAEPFKDARGNSREKQIKKWIREFEKLGVVFTEQEKMMWIKNCHLQNIEE